MTTQRIHLIRHGQTDWNRAKRVQGHAESQLTELGREQAAAVGERFARNPVEQVWVSSSQRTRQTAEIIFGKQGQPMEYCDQLKEIYLGLWEGKYQTEIRESHAEQFEHFWNRPHLFQLEDGAETFEQVQQRAMKRFHELCQTGAREIAIVSHGVWIKTVLCALEPRPLSLLWEPPLMHNCAHSIVEVEGDMLRIVQYADEQR